MYIKMLSTRKATATAIIVGALGIAKPLQAISNNDATTMNVANCASLALNVTAIIGAAGPIVEGGVATLQAMGTGMNYLNGLVAYGATSTTGYAITTEVITGAELIGGPFAYFIPETGVQSMIAMFTNELPTINGITEVVRIQWAECRTVMANLNPVPVVRELQEGLSAPYLNPNTGDTVPLILGKECANNTAFFSILSRMDQCIQCCNDLPNTAWNSCNAVCQAAYN